MSKRKLSDFAPDRWIRRLNQMEPDLWSGLRKAYDEKNLEYDPSQIGMRSVRDVPSWCYMPTLFPFLYLVSKNKEKYNIPNVYQYLNPLMSVASLYTWRASKGVYRFDREIYDILIKQPLEGNLPCECLFHLPEWAVYVETPGMIFEHVRLEGFIAHLDYNLMSGGTDLQFAIFAEGYEQPRMIALPLGEGSIADAMDRTDELDKAFIPTGKPRYIGTKDEYRATFTSMIQLLLYLCSDKPDLPEIEHPAKRIGLSGGVRTPSEPRVWDVGVRIASVIRKYREKGKEYDYNKEKAAKGSHSSPRPHVRAAHWHTYWKGPRDASFPDRQPILHWLPPIPVGIDWETELPVGIHMVTQ